MVLANCIGWIIYSLYIDDYFLFFANAPGAMVGVYFTLVGYGLSPYGSALRDQIERSGLWPLCSRCFALTLYVGLIAADASLDHKRFTMGIFCNVVLLVYYAAPLSTIKEVLVQRDSSSLYSNPRVRKHSQRRRGSSTASRSTILLFAPNGVGAVLGGVQLALIARFPTKERASSAPSAWGSQVD